MIEFKKVSFHYDLSGENANTGGSLTDIDLSVKKGETVLITGPSGCGKTTVLRLVNGLIPRYYAGEIRGEILVDGGEIKKKELYETAGICGMVFQNPRSQFFNVDTTSELAFGCENFGMPAEEIDRRVKETVERFGLGRLLGRSIFKLSGGEKQQIACASIDVAGPEIILLDEPSANLDYEATERLERMISVWKDMGKTILIAEHRIAWLWHLIDRAVIMENGRIVRQLSGVERFEVTEGKLHEMGLRTIVKEAPWDVQLPAILPEDEKIELRNFRFSYKRGMFENYHTSAVVNVDSLKLADGKITAIVGENGVGKTTLLNCLCGLEKHCKGEMIYRGKVYGRKERLQKVFQVMQDTNHQLFTESVMEELRISFPAETENADEKAMEILRELDLQDFCERHPMSLSGGQKQRLAIACAIASGKEILLFDEPTSGLDHFHMLEVSKLLKRLKDSGITILVVTHDTELIKECCDRRIVLRRND